MEWYKWALLGIGILCVGCLVWVLWEVKRAPLVKKEEDLFGTPKPVLQYEVHVFTSEGPYVSRTTDLRTYQNELEDWRATQKAFPDTILKVEPGVHVKR